MLGYSQIINIAQQLMLAQQANSFRSIDDLLQSSKDISIILKLLHKKKKLLAMIDSGKVSAKTYLSMCNDVIKKTTSSLIKDSVVIQVGQSEADINSWFKNVLSQTRSKLQNQEKRINQLSVGSQLTNQKSAIITQPPQFSKIQPDPKLRKAISNIPCLNMNKNTSIALQSKIISKIQPTNTNIKEANIKIQLQAQNKIIEPMEQKKSTLNPESNITSIQPKIFPLSKLVMQQQPKPNISNIISLVVLSQYLQKYKKDYDYCFELKQKGQKILQLVQSKKLTPDKYIRLLKDNIEVSEDKQALSLMKNQLQKLQQAKDSDRQKLFNQTLGHYINKARRDVIFRKSYDQMIQINSITINQAEPRLKIQYLLRKFGKYQSLLVFYKNNKLEKHFQKFQKEYKTIKKNTLQQCQKIKNGSNKIDVRKYAQQNLHGISFCVLHRQTKDSYINNINLFIKKLKESNTQITNYYKTLNVKRNKNNMQQCEKMTQKNKQNISYLEKLRNQQFVPFPLIQETKTDMYSTDLNKHLKQDQIQIIVTHIDGITGSLVFKIFIIDREKPQFQGTVINGQQNNIKIIMKIPSQKLQQMIKDTQKKYLCFALYQKNLFSQKMLAETEIQLNLINSNRMQQKQKMNQQKINIEYTINVYKPKKLKARITTIKLTKYPQYEHKPFIQNQFIKIMMPFQNPTQSEIRT